jgi:hypothetical protein
LLAEQSDLNAHRQFGKLPQAFSLVGIVNMAKDLVSGGGRPRSARTEPSRPRNARPPLDKRLTQSGPPGTLHAFETQRRRVHDGLEPSAHAVDLEIGHLRAGHSQ